MASGIRRFDPKVSSLCEDCPTREVCLVGTSPEVFECSWIKYVSEQLPKQVAEGKRSIQLSQSGWRYQWCYVMRPWEKVCTIVFAPVVAPFALAYLAFELICMIPLGCACLWEFVWNTRLTIDKREK